MFFENAQKHVFGYICNNFTNINMQSSQTCCNVFSCGALAAAAKSPFVAFMNDDSKVSTLICVF